MKTQAQYSDINLRDARLRLSDLLQATGSSLADAAASDPIWHTTLVNSMPVDRRETQKHNVLTHRHLALKSNQRYKNTNYNTNYTNH